jgi:hypothetical protein
LALLCSKHHELLHAAQNLGQPPHFEIIY